MKIQLLMLGKTRRPEIRALLGDYLKRIGHHVDVEAVELRDASAACKKLDSDRSAHLVLLDAAGKPFSSEDFAAWLGKLRDSSVRRLIFLCGDAEGFPDSLRERARMELSLGPLTLSHELARVVLAEQLYRAFAILAGSPYPK